MLCPGTVDSVNTLLLSLQSLRSFPKLLKKVLLSRDRGPRVLQVTRALADDLTLRPDTSSIFSVLGDDGEGTLGLHVTYLHLNIVRVYRRTKVCGLVTGRNLLGLLVYTSFSC